MTTTHAASPTLAPLESILSAPMPDGLAGLRDASRQRLLRLGLPTRRDEAWKYTSLRPLVAHEWALAPETAAPSFDEIAGECLAADASHRIVFVNGRLAPSLSNLGDLPPGVRVEDLPNVIAGGTASIEAVFGRLDRYQDDAFMALNTMACVDGAVVRIDANVVVERPIEIVFVTQATDTPIMVMPRVLVMAAGGSQANIVETFVSLGNGAPTVNNGVAEFIVGANATITHDRVVREPDDAIHIAALLARIDDDGNFTSTNVTLEGGIIRNSVAATLNGTNVDATFNGLFMPRGQEHVDNYLRIDHLHPHCRSWQFYKGILEDQATGAFCGRIFVELDAQKTDAKQTNMNLLLSDDAKMNTRPQLEIFADDVKCTHGATIGQIEPSQLFYLQARGIDREAARSLLIHAFANEVLDEVAVDGVRQRLEQDLLDRLPRGDRLLAGI